MANSRDFTGKNRKFTGTKGVTVPKGTTGQRIGGESGELRFNTTTELMEYYDGNAWKPIDAPPTISSISTSDAQGTNNILNADGSTLHTITITGGNFGIGANVKFIGNTGTEYTAGNINRVSGSSITCTTLITMGTADDPYDVQLINASGLSALLEDAFSFNAAPVFVNASGSLGTVFNGQAITGTTFNAGATDAEANTITFSIISGALPGTGLTLSSSTGAITGTLASTPSLGNYSFNVRAATTEGNAERQFSIQVIANPFVTATGGTTSNSGGYKYHSFTSGGNFIVSYAGTSPSNTLEYLVVAGGGCGGGQRGGGGGAGGYISSSTTASATTYVITVGGGGVRTGPVENQGTPGTNSTGFSQTAIGGGGGGGDSPSYSAGLNGGSGGGIPAGYPGALGLGTPGQGNNGGSAPGLGPHYGAGGGGGKNAPGGDGTTTVAGNGGNGLAWLNGTNYGGGGGGGSYQDSNSNPGGAGGTGGGGRSASRLSATQGEAGATNTGGGGGGGSNGSGYLYPGGPGGSGIVIVRYELQ